MTTLIVTTQAELHPAHYQKRHTMDCKHTDESSDYQDGGDAA